MFGVGCGLLTMPAALLRLLPRGGGLGHPHHELPGVAQWTGWACPAASASSPFTVTRRWFTRRPGLPAGDPIRPAPPARRPGRPEGGQGPRRGLSGHPAGPREGPGPPAAPAGGSPAACSPALHVFTDLDTARAELRQRQELLAQVMPQASTSSETPYRANGALSIQAGYTAQGELGRLLRGGPEPGLQRGHHHGGGGGPERRGHPAWPSPATARPAPSAPRP